MRRLTELAHDILRASIQPGDAVLDATAGNGHDTRLLAECVGPSGRVYAFDLQAGSIAALQSLPAQVRLFEADHARLVEFVREPIAAACFNLGYLPGGDHAIVTAAESTVAAVAAAWGLLKPGGVLTIIAYRGHPGGEAEASVVREWLDSRNDAECGFTESPGPWLAVVRKQPENPGIGSPEKH
jgi:predicted methyltransferase